MVTHNILEVKKDMNKIYEISDKKLVLLHEYSDQPAEKVGEEHDTAI
jgi:hypothetical protein